MKVSVQHRICLISSRIEIKTPTRVEHLQIAVRVGQQSTNKIVRNSHRLQQSIDSPKNKKTSHLSSAGICKRKSRRRHQSSKQSSVLGFGSRNVNVPPAAKYRQTELDYHNTPVVSCSAYTSAYCCSLLYNVNVCTVNTSQILQRSSLSILSTSFDLSTAA